jgi:hypothetical protein
MINHSTEEHPMAKNGTVAYVDNKPKCQFTHSVPVQAEYDFRTKSGQWAYGCELHWQMLRLHINLGVGKGQKLELSINEKENS